VLLYLRCKTVSFRCFCNLRVCRATAIAWHLASTSPGSPWLDQVGSLGCMGGMMQLAAGRQQAHSMLLLMVVAGFALDLGAKDVQLTLDVAGR
jgi:hypothetical protein